MMDEEKRLAWVRGLRKGDSVLVCSLGPMKYWMGRVMGLGPKAFMVAFLYEDGKPIEMCRRYSRETGCVMSKGTTQLVEPTPDRVVLAGYLEGSRGY
jgi:hypothetical protein